MKARSTHGQEEKEMQLTALKIGLGLATLATSLVFAAGATARVPVEPGPGSPVTHSHPRRPAARKTVRRNLGGYPARSGQHVRSDAEARTE